MEEGSMGMMTVAQLQTHVYEDKMKNVEMLTPLLWQAKEYHADFVCLPEMFACQRSGVSISTFFILSSYTCV